MVDINYICPIPKKWHEIHQLLSNHWEKNSGLQNKKPPTPIILAGWNFSDDWQKKERWLETIKWVKENQCEHLIPELAQDEKYFG